MCSANDKEIAKLFIQYQETDWQKVQAVYYEVDTGQIFHVGQNVIYKGQTLWVYRASMFLERGMLQCKYQLTAKEYDPFPIIYNPHLRCHSLQGIVLERVGETVKVHLYMDEAQEWKMAG